MLVIMDGWGLGTVPSSDAIQNANVPFVSSLYNRYPHTTLTTCGEAVGLPEGQMGNSEVGHLNLGAGRIVYQELQRINVAIREGELAQNEVLLNSIRYAIEQGKPLHLLGLVSDGGVHSHTSHLKAILDTCQQNGFSNVFIHVFTDGRDTDPRSGLAYVQDMEDYCQQSVGRIATVSGRYYAMDRDNRWERVKLAYDAMVRGIGQTATSAREAISQSYAEAFNFRTDRCREITKALTQIEFAQQEMKPLNLHYTTMTEYDATFKGVHVIFETDNLNNTLGEIIERNGLQQVRIAETEKYPHVTFFFSGGREKPFEGEQRLMVSSPKVATYDLQPEMSAPEVTTAILAEIEKGEASFICLNYANADMVGHTGVWEAAIKAAETVDRCVAQVVTTALQHGYTIFLTADHGNADYMINADGTPNTAHTLNLVPLFVIDNDWKGSLKEGKLGDIAPTILTMMGLGIPEEMTGDILTA
ncbi:MAG: 2,3-bisphosphoglycerate-independent phosphoglycerate mutase [Chitinophagaceae bacterium]|nr:MAG: 2,3-bisphosphoglycerate-independent phosphoglycerate mutase [Chitinophagaceae bacterium]